MVSFRKCSAISRKKVRLLHTHHVIYIIYSMVGRSITSIFDLGGILTSALCASVNMVPRVGYISNGPPYYTMYITYNSVWIYVAKPST